MKKKHSAFDAINSTILVLIALVMLYPFWYVLMGSLMTNAESMVNPYKLFAKFPTLEAYKIFFENTSMVSNLLVSTYITLAGAFLGLVFTSMAAYALSRKYLPGRRTVNKYITFTMLFSGGMIPYFLVVKALGLYNKLEALYIPTLINAYYLIIMRTNFSSIPDSLEESAKIDGAYFFEICCKLSLPQSKPVLAPILLCYAVDHWNDMTSGLLFIMDPKKQPLQTTLYRILSNQDSQLTNAGVSLGGQFSTKTLQNAATIITVLPILIVYPLLQKYFVTGVTLGAVKE